MAFVDLHTHSTASDGTMSPTELMRAAADAGLAAIALTDHDTGNGLKEAAEEAGRLGMRFVPGVEISAEYPAPGTLHILGHFVDAESAGLKKMSETLLAGRNARNPKIVAQLNELGCKMTMEMVEAVARRNAARSRSGGGVPGNEGTSARAVADGGLGVVIGRPHIAQALVDAGCVASIKQAFDVYLDRNGAAYFAKERLTPRQAIACIHQAGGLATVAHPVQLRCENPAHLATVINHLKEAGMDGIEVWHCDHDERVSGLMLELAKRYDLVPTGGSDFHGSPKPDVVLGRGRNNVRVPVEVLDRLEARWRELNH